MAPVLVRLARLSGVVRSNLAAIGAVKVDGITPSWSLFMLSVSFLPGRERFCSIAYGRTLNTRARRSRKVKHECGFSTFPFLARLRRVGGGDVPQPRRSAGVDRDMPSTRNGKVRLQVIAGTAAD